MTGFKLFFCSSSLIFRNFMFELFPQINVMKVSCPSDFFFIKANEKSLPAEILKTCLISMRVGSYLEIVSPRPSWP